MQHQTGQIVRKSISGILTVWLSGFVFVFCCHASLAAQHGHDSCPMARQSHHCDRHSEQAGDATAANRAEGTCLINCGYLPAVFDKARKVDQSAPVVAPPRAASVARLFTPRPTRARQASAYRARLTDKSRTFISIQVFRI